MSDDERWIVIPNWEKFQHYSDSRGLHWIKDHLEQLDRDDYLELSFALRGLLSDLRKLYGRRRGVLRGDTRTISRALSQQVTERQLTSLNHAGLIEFSSSRPLALARAGARPRTRSREEISKEISQERGRASERPSARPPAPEQKEQPRRPEQHERDELPERDPEAAAKIRALAAQIGIRIPSGRPDENGALDDDPFA